MTGWPAVTPKKNNAHLAILLPHLRMLSAQNLRVEVTVSLRWNGLGVCLSTDLYTLAIDERDMLRNERIVERVEVESR